MAPAFHASAAGHHSAPTTSAHDPDAAAVATFLRTIVPDATRRHANVEDFLLAIVRPARHRGRQFLKPFVAARQSLDQRETFDAPPLPFPSPSASIPIDDRWPVIISAPRARRDSRRQDAKSRAPTTMAASRSGSNSCATCSSAAAKISFRRPGVLDFAHRATAASSAASFSSRVSNNCSAFSAVVRRPAAFSRGPRRKPVILRANRRVNSATFHQFPDPGALRASDLSKAVMDEQPIFHPRRNDVRHAFPAPPSPDAPSGRSRSAARVLQQCVAEAETRSLRCRDIEGAASLETFGVHYRDAIAAVLISARDDRGRSHRAALVLFSSAISPTDEVPQSTAIRSCGWNCCQQRSTLSRL